MRINGTWIESDSGVVEPRVAIDVLAADGSWNEVQFLIDTGADRTVFSYDLLYLLQLEPEES
jgi:hypothetical protein